MAVHYNGNQINQAFKPSRLGNWEVSCTINRKPKPRTGKTEIISNNNGHLLPGVRRPNYPGAGPWGRFVPTWHMPKKITKDIIPTLQCPHLVEKKKQLAEIDKSKADAPKPIETRHYEDERPPPGTDPCKDMEDKAEKPKDEEMNLIYSPRDDDKLVEENMSKLTYVPGDLTEPKYRHPTYEVLHPKKELTLEDLHKEEMERYNKHVAEKSAKKEPKLNPFACVYRNFELAKRCAKENLEHHPLPDTVTNKMFQKLQMERALAPGLAIDEDIKATGIGWKGYGLKGPTQCTKMQVYRPKTSAPKKLKNLECRPGSCASFDMKWRFIKQKNVTPIELAICWDMCPENPADEPKRTTHIDGSNGSAAPAVFQMVQSPKQPDQTNSRKSSASCDGIHGCGTDKASSAGSRRSRSIASIKDEEFRPKPSMPMKAFDPNNNLKRNRSISTNSLYVNAPQTRKLSKESNKTYESIESKIKNSLSPIDSKLYKSSPNLSINSCANSCCHKNNNNNNNNNAEHLRKSKCLTCNQNSFDKEEKPKSEYKTAFKAGKVQESRSFDGSSGSSSKTYVKVPKQKDPYAKRNYDINSLHPPFSLWKGTSCQSYPEHWRLASIYQHSYKPPENRKKPLMSSVFQ